jgi:hypothetical protein
MQKTEAIEPGADQKSERTIRRKIARASGNHTPEIPEQVANGPAKNSPSRQ